MEAAASGARGAQRFVVTEAEREVADLLPIEVDPEFARATVRGVPLLVSHLRAESRRGHLHARVARDQRYRVAMLPADCHGCACSTSVGSMASTRSSPSVAGPSGCWRSTTSSTGCGSLPAGESSWRAERDFARTIPCCARRSGIGGWTRSRSTASTSVSLRHSSSGGEPAGAVAAAAWTDGQRRDGADRDVRAWPGAAGRCRDSGLPGRRRCTRATSSCTGRSGTPAWRGLP